MNADDVERYEEWLSNEGRSQEFRRVLAMNEESERGGEGFGLSRWAFVKGSKLGRSSIICVDARRSDGSSVKNLAKLGKGATSRGLNGSATRLPGFTSWVFRAEGCCSATPDGKMCHRAAVINTVVESGEELQEYGERCVECSENNEEVQVSREGAGAAAWFRSMSCRVQHGDSDDTKEQRSACELYRQRIWWYLRNACGGDYWRNLDAAKVDGWVLHTFATCIEGPGYSWPGDFLALTLDVEPKDVFEWTAKGETKEEERDADGAQAVAGVGGEAAEPTGDGDQHEPPALSDLGSENGSDAADSDSSDGDFEDSVSHSGDEAGVGGDGLQTLSSQDSERVGHLNSQGDPWHGEAKHLTLTLVLDGRHFDDVTVDVSADLGSFAAAFCDEHGLQQHYDALVEYLGDKVQEQAAADAHVLERSQVDAEIDANAAAAAEAVADEIDRARLAAEAEEAEAIVATAEAATAATLAAAEVTVARSAARPKRSEEAMQRRVPNVARLGGEYQGGGIHGHHPPDAGGTLTVRLTTLLVEGIFFLL